MNRQGQTVARLKRRPASVAKHAWPMIFIATALPAILAGDVASLPFALIWIIVGAIWVWRAWMRNEDPAVVPATVEVDEEGIVVDGERFARADIRSAYVIPGPPPRVRLLARRRLTPLDLRFDSLADADRFLEEARLGAQDQVSVFHALAGRPQGVLGWLRRLGPIALVFLLYLWFRASQPWILGLMAVPGLLHASGVRRRAHVGSDGVRLERGIAWDRFLAYGEIADARVSRMQSSSSSNQQYFQAALKLHDGGEERVGFHSRDEAEAFARQVLEARDRAVDAPVVEALVRDTDDAAAWVKRLRAVTQRHSHRHQATSPDRLLAILESPAASPRDRAAAAVALGPALDDGSRKRIADVASSTASPRLRVVLDAVRDDADDEALAEALASLEAEEAQARAST